MKSFLRHVAMGSMVAMVAWFGVVGFAVAEGSATNPSSPGGGSATNPASGQGTPTVSANGTIEFPNPTPYDSIMELLEEVLRAVVRILMPVIAIMFIVSGFLFVTAGGDVKKLETAKQTFLGTVIGTAIVLGAWALATAIAGTIQRL